MTPDDDDRLSAMTNARLSELNASAPEDNTAVTGARPIGEAAATQIKTEYDNVTAEIQAQLGSGGASESEQSAQSGQFDTPAAGKPESEAPADDEPVSPGTLPKPPTGNAPAAPPPPVIAARVKPTDADAPRTAEILTERGMQLDRLVASASADAVAAADAQPARHNINPETLEQFAGMLLKTAAPNAQGVTPHTAQLEPAQPQQAGQLDREFDKRLGKLLETVPDTDERELLNSIIPRPRDVIDQINADVAVYTDEPAGFSDNPQWLFAFSQSKSAAAVSRTYMEQQLRAAGMAPQSSDGAKRIADAMLEFVKQEVIPRRGPLLGEYQQLHKSSERMLEQVNRMITESRQEYVDKLQAWLAERVNALAAEYMSQHPVPTRADVAALRASAKTCALQHEHDAQSLLLSLRATLFDQLLNSRDEFAAINSHRRTVDGLNAALHDAADAIAASAAASAQQAAIQSQPEQPDTRVRLNADRTPDAAEPGDSPSAVPDGKPADDADAEPDDTQSITVSATEADDWDDAAPDDAGPDEQGDTDNGNEETPTVDDWSTSEQDSADADDAEAADMLEGGDEADPDALPSEQLSDKPGTEPVSLAAVLGHEPASNTEASSPADGLRVDWAHTGASVSPGLDGDSEAVTDLVDDEPAKPRRKWLIALVIIISVLVAAAAVFGVTGYVYPGFMRSKPAAAAQSPAVIKHIKQVQGKFRVGDTLEIASSNGMVNASIQSFDRKGCIATDQSGQKWRVSNEQLAGWLHKHAADFSSRQVQAPSWR